MHWFVANVYHFEVPVALLLGLFSVVIGLRRRKEGIKRLVLPKAVLVGFYGLIGLAFIMIGIVIATKS